MTLLRPTSSPPDPSTPSPKELVRPGSPPARVITPPHLRLLALDTEDSPEDVLSNYMSRAMHLLGEVLIGGIGAATVADLTADRQMVAGFETDDVGSISISITARAKQLVDGAGIPLMDFRGVTPTAEELAAMISDRRIVGALLSHIDQEDEARPSWRVLLKPAELRRLDRLRLVDISVKPRKRRIHVWLAGLELTARQYAQLIAALTALVTAILALLKILGA